MGGTRTNRSNPRSNALNIGQSIHRHSSILRIVQEIPADAFMNAKDEAADHFPMVLQLHGTL